ncbi:hypothetical protein RF11_15953 [Thelohanellus kitauei]|uniref:Uncharacterized protein n=1 Tax=Thelohanellus kitauei TaxID=669202 RepID=A0A0C2IM48_THEKT|nr:hypothetical protein RF11_15953 [Thelohanellus kitauei]
MLLASSFDAPSPELTESLQNEEMNSFSLVTPMSGNLAPPAEVYQYNEPESRFRSLISASVGTVLNFQPRLAASQSCFSSRSITSGYTSQLTCVIRVVKTNASTQSPSKNQEAYLSTLAPSEHSRSEVVLVV